MAKLINGNGNPAIYAGEDADLIASLAGNVTCIANVGNKYAATEEDANTIGLADGVIITKEGRRIQLDAGETDLFTIPTGSSGVTNYYIIGYKLVQNADSTQVAETFVQKMNSSSEIITENTFRGGATEVYVSLYRVTQVGFTIDSIDSLLSKLLDSAAIKANIAQINTALGNKSDASMVQGNNAFQKIGNLNAVIASVSMQNYHTTFQNLSLSGTSFIIIDISNSIPSGFKLNTNGHLSATLNSNLGLASVAFVSALGNQVTIGFSQNINSNFNLSISFEIIAV